MRTTRYSSRTWKYGGPRDEGKTDAGCRDVRKRDLASGLGAGMWLQGTMLAAAKGKDDTLRLRMRKKVGSCLQDLAHAGVALGLSICVRTSTHGQSQQSYLDSSQERAAFPLKRHMQAETIIRKCDTLASERHQGQCSTRKSITPQGLSTISFP